ncbi:MAG: hypothetical protein ABH956_02005 [Candidatus Nealsonbacteria bacterium]
MKKLNLVGVRKTWFGVTIKKIVAKVYIQDGKVIVESGNEKVKEDLQREIDRLAYQGAFMINTNIEKRDKQGNLIQHQRFVKLCKPDNPKFLDSLRSATWFWHKKIFGGYEIYQTISKIVAIYKKIYKEVLYEN